MGEAEGAKIDVNEEGQDLITKLPEALLVLIISFLPVKDAVRTSVLSPQWFPLWKRAPNLNFDQKLMLNTAVPRSLHFSNPTLRTAIDDAANLINSALDNHTGHLTSCRILHLIDSCITGDAVGWMMKLSEEKEVKELYMECEYFESWGSVRPLVRQHASTLFLPSEVMFGFQVLELKNYMLKTSPPREGSHNLKTLKLTLVSMTEEILEGIVSNCLSLEKLSLIGCRVYKRIKIHSPSIKFLELSGMVVRWIDVSAVNLDVIEFDTMICHPKGLAIDTPNVRVFHFRCDLKYGGVPSLEFGSILLTPRETLETCSGLLSYAGYYRHANIFKNLVTLSIDLNLNTVRDAIPLSFVLGSCLCLQNLEINNKIIERGEVDNGSSNEFSVAKNISQDVRPPYPSSMFWERTQFCECVSYKLKTVYITGYKGKTLEVEFFKYLISNARMLERITICFDNDCTWKEATATVCLLSMARASENLSITMKPGEEYMAKVGGSFGNWISTLKLN